MATHQITHPNSTVKSIPACRHDVHFYETDSALGEELARHIGPALERDDTTIVIATKTHCKELRQALRVRGIDVKAALKAERYIERDASKTLALFMVGGVPNKKQFHNTIGGLVGRAIVQKATGKELVLFGEMVALLWADGKRDATVRLEELWNELGEQYSFHLLCAYPAKAFDSPEHKHMFFNICGEHTEVNKQASLDPTMDVPWVRQSVLKNEIRLSQQRILVLRKVTKAGTWELDIANDLFSFSSAGAKVLGYQSASRLRLSELLGLMYYSGDREAVFERLQHAQRHRKEFTAHFRIGNQEETRLIHMHGTTFYNAGRPIMLGVVSDITPAG
jgi:PAS domain-containing protein